MHGYVSRLKFTSTWFIYSGILKSIVQYFPRTSRRWLITFSDSLWRRTLHLYCSSWCFPEEKTWFWGVASSRIYTFWSLIKVYMWNIQFISYSSSLAMFWRCSFVVVRSTALNKWTQWYGVNSISRAASNSVEHTCGRNVSESASGNDSIFAVN